MKENIITPVEGAVMVKERRRESHTFYITCTCGLPFWIILHVPAKVYPHFVLSPIFDKTERRAVFFSIRFVLLIFHPLPNSTLSRFLQCFTHVLPLMLCVVLRLCCCHSSSPFSRHHSRNFPVSILCTVLFFFFVLFLLFLTSHFTSVQSLTCFNVVVLFCFKTDQRARPMGKS